MQSSGQFNYNVFFSLKRYWEEERIQYFKVFGKSWKSFVKEAWKIINRIHGWENSVPAGNSLETTITTSFLSQINSKQSNKFQMFCRLEINKSQQLSFLKKKIQKGSNVFIFNVKKERENFLFILEPVKFLSNENKTKNN